MNPKKNTPNQRVPSTAKSTSTRFPISVKKYPVGASIPSTPNVPSKEDLLSNSTQNTGYKNYVSTVPVETENKQVQTGNSNLETVLPTYTKKKRPNRPQKIVMPYGPLAAEAHSKNRQAPAKHRLEEISERNNNEEITRPSPIAAPDAAHQQEAVNYSSSNLFKIAESVLLSDESQIAPSNHISGNAASATPPLAPLDTRERNDGPALISYIATESIVQPITGGNESYSAINSPNTSSHINLDVNEGTHLPFGYREEKTVDPNPNRNQNFVSNHPNLVAEALCTPLEFIQDGDSMSFSGNSESKRELSIHNLSRDSSHLSESKRTQEVDSKSAAQTCKKPSL